MRHPVWQRSSFSGGGEGNDCVELASSTPTPPPLGDLLRAVRDGLL
ncbi:DUF397 domain-containing protein [Streptomyces antibioticus]